MTKTYVVDGTTYAFTTAYDAAGRVLWQDYPDGDTLGTPGTPFTYDGAGPLSTVPGVIDQALYDARGWAEQLTRANGVVTSYTYSPERGWLDGLMTSSGGHVRASRWLPQPGIRRARYGHSHGSSHIRTRSTTSARPTCIELWAPMVPIRLVKARKA